MADSDWFIAIAKFRGLFENAYQGTVFGGPVGTLVRLPDRLGGAQQWRPSLQALVAGNKAAFFELLQAKAHFLMLPKKIVTTLKESSRFQLDEASVGSVAQGRTDYDEETHTAVCHVPGASASLARSASGIGRNNDRDFAGVETIYHEMTHAWLALHEFYDDEFQKLYADGVAAYQSVKLDTGSEVPAWIGFTEAAAYYVGDKISRWCDALYRLDEFSRFKPQDPVDLQFQLESIAVRYNKFQPTYGKTLLGTVQSPDLSTALRDAIDKMILDGCPLTKPFDDTPLASLRAALSGP